MHNKIDDQVLYSHPVFNPNDLRIATPAIGKLKENLKRFVWTGATGAAILGFTRAGKSTALEILENELTSRAGDQIPVARYSVHKRDKKQIRTLIANICLSRSIKVKTRDTAEVLVDRFIIYLAEKAQEYKTRTLVLTIDEAQRLAIGQIDLFAELYDRLRDEYGIHLTVFFVGNSEQVGKLLKTITNGDHEHIEGRFFRSHFRFEGLTSRSDVEFCLNQYDTLKYPEGGPTYTEFFLPDDYAKGFRLKDLSKDIWGIFNHHGKTLGVREWGMEYFTRLTNVLLTDYLHIHGASAYSTDMLVPCMDVSGFIPDQIQIDP